MYYTFMLRRIVKRLFWYARGGYKPEEFWDRWAVTFMDDPWQRKLHPQHEWILERIQKQKPESILEIGCGFGRNVKYLIENGIKASSITAVDFSPIMIAKAGEYVENKNVHFQVADARSLPFKDKQFDLVLVHGVFMHIKPEDFEQALGEAVRVCGKNIISVEQNYLTGDNGKKYTFVHDYKSLYRKSGCKILEYVHNKKEGLDYYYVEVR